MCRRKRLASRARKPEERGRDLASTATRDFRRRKEAVRLIEDAREAAGDNPRLFARLTSRKATKGVTHIPDDVTEVTPRKETSQALVQLSREAQKLLINAGVTIPEMVQVRQALTELERLGIEVDDVEFAKMVPTVNISELVALINARNKMAALSDEYRTGSMQPAETEVQSTLDRLGSDTDLLQVYQEETGQGSLPLTTVIEQWAIDEEPPVPIPVDLKLQALLAMSDRGIYPISAGSA